MNSHPHKDGDSGTTVEDGGPAFPCEVGGDPANNFHQTGPYIGQQYGMSLRDYFAAKFMSRAQSLCETAEGWNSDNAAQCAWEMADAMIRNRGGAA